MAKTGSVLLPVLGGVAAMLSIAYGVASRDYRSNEIAAAESLAASYEQSAAAATARATDLEADLAALNARVQAQAEELAALQAEIASAAQAAPEPEPVAAAPAPEPVPEVQPVTLALGDAERGAKIYGQCSGCHKVGNGAKNGVGPHLNSVFDRRAGSIEGFKYSKSMERAYGDGLVWDLEHLDAYIENPRALVSGTRMSFRGLEDQQDRNDLLAYLRTFSESPQDLPEAAPTAVAREVALSDEILSIVGDVAYGEYLAAECLTCHRRDGGDDGIPSIVYWPEEDFVIAMHAYKQKLRPHPVMQMMAGRLDDEEIASLAAYFATLE